MAIIINDKIINILDKKIQVNNFNRYISAQYDNDTTEKYFKIKRFYNNLDLSKFACWVVVERADQEIFNCYCTTTVGEETLEVLWKIDGNVTQIGGDIELALKFYDTEDNLIWQTAKATFEIYDSIDSNKGQESKHTPSMIEEAIAITTKNAQIVEKQSEQVAEDAEQVAEDAEQVAEDAQFVKENAEKLDEILNELTYAAGRRTEEGGEIFNDYENNVAIGVGSSARGLLTQAGNKAFKILNITKIEYSDATDDYILTVRGNVTDNLDPYTIEDLVQITANVGFGNSYKIKELEYLGYSDVYETEISTITITQIDKRVVQSMKLSTKDDTDNIHNWICVPGKKIGEVTPWTTIGWASGLNTIASGKGAFAAGENNKAMGDWSATFGRNNSTGYAGFATGKGNIAGDYAFVGGNSNIAGGINSVATGIYNIASHYASRAGGTLSTARVAYGIAEGIGVITTGKSEFEGTSTEGQHVIGKYNRVTHNAIFVIGCGNSEESRKNALEITLDGKILIEDGLYEIATKYYVDTTKQELNDYISTYNTDINNKINSLIVKGNHANSPGIVLMTSKHNAGYYASGECAFSFGDRSTASEYGTVAGGIFCEATKRAAAAGGELCQANGKYSFAYGLYSNALQDSTVALGEYVEAYKKYQIAVGSYTRADDTTVPVTDGNYDARFLVGVGISNVYPKNGFAVYRDGSARLRTQGENANAVVIKSYVDDKFNSIKNEMILTDKTTGADYKVYVNNGKLQIEEVIK